MFKIGVMASGGGSNFKAIIDHIGEGDLEAQCKFLITNNGGCGAVGHAESYGIPVYHISGKTHPDTAAYEAAMLEVIDRYDIDLLILAGYMKALPVCIIKRLPDRILPRLRGELAHGYFAINRGFDTFEKCRQLMLHRMLFA